MKNFLEFDKVPFALIHGEFSQGIMDEAQLKYNEKTQMMEGDITQIKEYWKTKTGLFDSDQVHGDK